MSTEFLGDECFSCHIELWTHRIHVCHRCDEMYCEDCFYENPCQAAEGERHERYQAPPYEFKETKKTMSPKVKRALEITVLGIVLSVLFGLLKKKF